LRAGVGEPRHLLRRRPVLATARGIEFDRVECLTAQDNHGKEVPS
jgi:hypothetical protein